MCPRIALEATDQIADSPVTRIAEIVDNFFRAAPQPKVKTEAARRSGERVGRHLMGLWKACGRLNFEGLHSAAIALFRPLEDALDCLAAVTIVAGAAERWEIGELKPADAARMWDSRLRIIDAKGTERPNYRKELRDLFNHFAHCAPVLTDWDVFVERDATDSSGFRFGVNHDPLLIYANCRRIDAYLVAHCAETLTVLELGYSDYIKSNDGLRIELDVLEKRLRDSLKGLVEDGLLDNIVPLELQECPVKPGTPIPQNPMRVNGQWAGTWTCATTDTVRASKMLLKQQRHIVNGWLRIENSSNGKRVLVTEDLSGVVTDSGVLLIDGVGRKLDSATNDFEYKLDSFELRFNAGGELAGTHQCALGCGRAQFHRR